MRIRRAKSMTIVLSVLAVSLAGVSTHGQQVDCNENGLPDDEDIASGRSTDCTGSGVPDECEIDKNSKSAGGPFFCTANCLSDCNLNGILDTCEMSDCGTVDVVFMLDTSNSTLQELADTCLSISEALGAIDPSILVASEILAITDGGNACSCCTGFVDEVYCDTAIGFPDVEILGTCIESGEQDREDWGPATAVVAANRDWTDGPRIIVPISDEGPRCGGGDAGGGVPGNLLDPLDPADALAVEHAIDAVWAKRVAVAPVVNTADAPLLDLALDIVAGAAVNGEGKIQEFLRRVSACGVMVYGKRALPGGTNA